MLESAHFKNFRVLRDAVLPLTNFTLILGPNGSGKSTALAGIYSAGHFNVGAPENRSKGVESAEKVSIILNWRDTHHHGKLVVAASGATYASAGASAPTSVPHEIGEWLRSIRVFSLDADRIAADAALSPDATIDNNGANLAVVLTQLQDRHRERFDALNAELATWLPEFDRIIVDTTANSRRAFFLQTKSQRHIFPAGDLSHGTLFALCILTLAHLPSPPSLVCLEEPDRGIHPRLLRQVHDAMLRLSDPSSSGDQRKPVQVIATTHSPYLLDHFRDHPEDVVLAEKTEDGATFHQLTAMPHYEEIMHDAQLGDAWYTGILGGVPAAP